MEIKASVSLCHTIITDKIRVSTAMLPRTDAWGEWTLIETWIFSDDTRQESVQVIHTTRRKALKIHKYIARNLIRKFAHEKTFNKS